MLEEQVFIHPQAATEITGLTPDSSKGKSAYKVKTIN